MMEQDPQSLVESAYIKGELVKLTLGKKPYIYISKYAGGHPSDLTQIYSGMISFAKTLPQGVVQEKIQTTLESILKSPEGCHPVATFVLCETIRLSGDREVLGLDLKKLNQLLYLKIRNSEDKLRKKNKWFQEDAFTDLKRINKIIVSEFDGSGFME